MIIIQIITLAITSLKVKGFLQGIMNHRTPIPFVINVNNENLFLIKNERASLFIFLKFTCSY